MPDGASEDEFAYHQFVHACVEAGPALELTDAATWLAKLESVAGDDLVTQVALCDGMIQGVERRSGRHFKNCSRMRRRRLQAPRPSNMSSETSRGRVRAHTFWIEGVAWTAIARSRGWQPPEAMPLCPPPALPGSPPIVVGDLSLELERQFGL